MACNLHLNNDRATFSSLFFFDSLFTRERSNGFDVVLSYGMDL